MQSLSKIFEIHYPHLHRYILVQSAPITDPSSGDSKLVCEMFSFRMSVHHPPFCISGFSTILPVPKAHAIPIKWWVGSTTSSSIVASCWSIYRTIVSASFWPPLYFLPLYLLLAPRNQQRWQTRPTRSGLQSSNLGTRCCTIFPFCGLVVASLLWSGLQTIPDGNGDGVK